MSGVARHIADQTRCPCHHRLIRESLTAFTPPHGSPLDIEDVKGEEGRSVQKRSSPRPPRRWRGGAGFTLVELLVGAVILMIGIVVMLGEVVSESTLNEHARNLTWALNDANRVMERLRQQNSGSGCTTPSAAAPTGFASWDAWLADTTASGGGGKSVQPNPTTNELVVVTSTGSDPLTITVAVCWRHRNRTLGECSWNGAQLVPSDTNGNGVIESPAMLSTLMTCRK